MGVINFQEMLSTFDELLVQKVLEEHFNLHHPELRKQVKEETVTVEIPIDTAREIAAEMYDSCPVRVYNPLVEALAKKENELRDKELGTWTRKGNKQCFDIELAELERFQANLFCAAFPNEACRDMTLASISLARALDDIVYEKGKSVETIKAAKKALEDSGWRA